MPLCKYEYRGPGRYGGHAGWDRRTVVPILLEKLPYAALTAIAAAMTLWATWDSRIYESEPLVTKLLARQKT